MLAIDGSIQVVPFAFASDIGELRVGDETKPAVVQSYQTQSGVVQIILSVEEIDKVIKQLEDSKEKAIEMKTSHDSDLYIPPSAEEALEQAGRFKQVQDEITAPK